MIGRFLRALRRHDRDRHDRDRDVSGREAAPGFDPFSNPTLDETRREAAMSLMDPGVVGFVLVAFVRNESDPDCAWPVVSQVTPSHWVPTACAAILAGQQAHE